MALAYTAPTWTDGSGTGISASQLQALCNCIEGLVQGSDKAVHTLAMSNSTITLTFADGTQETVTATGLKGVSTITKTATVGLVDTYTITYSDGSTSTFTITNGAAGSAPTITMTASTDAVSSPTPTVAVTKTGTDENPNFALAFSGLKGSKGDTGDTGSQGPAGASAGFGTPSASVDSGTGTPSVSVSASGPDTAKVFAFSFSNLKGAKGDTGATGSTGATGPAGADGADGVSPEVTITTITGGHSVTITDKDHPTGQTFNVMDGTGSGDMQASTYDPQGTVATAGGIVAYINDTITAALTASY